VKYVSTRGRAPAASFADVLLSGLAPDGGLYVPQAWPRLAEAEIAALAGRSYEEVAVRVLRPYVAGALSDADLAADVAAAYRAFDAEGVAPLRPIGDGEWLMELFHGPTLAFKDIALQLLGRLFDRVLKAQGERVALLGATSGDTGSAAIEACRDKPSIEIFMLHPGGRVSEVQRRQMTCVLSANVHNVAVDGTFDDCQALVKALFADPELRRRHRLAAVNSINWARIAVQAVYYVFAAAALGDPARPIAFAVPTGNFGNVFAGYVASRMGLPVRRLVVGSNRNDVLTRFFASGRMEAEPVVATLSPSMDIQVSSNFERLLFELLDRDGAAVAALMAGFRESGRFAVGQAELRRAKELFDGASFDDQETLAAIRDHYRATGHLIDPHTAVGLLAGRAKGREPGVPLVALATAHPAKFADAVERATGLRPELPPGLADLLKREERCARLPNDFARVRAFVLGRLAERRAA
jgi:threonine synthase